jgi:glycosyltransferase involved in cell wall biosynthesis
MRIRYFHHGLWPSPSPSTTFVTWTCAGFAETGADFELLTVADTAETVPQVLAGQFGIDTPLPLRLLRAGPFRRAHRIVHALAFWHFLFAEWEVLITRNLGFLPWALLLRRLRGGRVVFESHDFYADPSLRDDPAGRAGSKQARRERRWLAQVDGVLCVSEPQRAYYLQSFPGQRFFTALSGVKASTRPSTPRAGPGNTVGYLGSFDAERYDLDLVLRSMALVAVPGSRLLMVGARNKSEHEAMSARAAALGIADRVEVLPWQSPRELEAVKARLDVGLVPLAITPRNRIGTPLKALEYLADGIPSVASDLPGIHDLLDDGPCGLVAQSSPESWAAAITRVLTEPALARALSEAAGRRALDLSWGRRAERIMDFLLQLESGRRHATSLPSVHP